MDKVIIVDFDDTLFFTKELVEKAAEIIAGVKLKKEEIRKLPKSVKSKIYDYAFTKLNNYAKVNQRLVGLLKDYHKKGYKIIILSARLKEHYKDTIKLLKKYNIPFDSLVLRENLSMKDEEWKLKIIREMGANEIIVFEDKLDNIEYLMKNIDRTNIKFFLVKEDRIEEITQL